MSDLTRAFGRAIGSVVHPRMLWLMVWPMAVSVAIWGILAFLFGATLLDSILQLLSSFSLYQRAAEWAAVPVIAKTLAWILLILLFIPLVLTTATLIISVVSMPMMVRHVAGRDYPALERRGGTMVGGVWNAIVALFWLAVLVVVTLPLWLMVPLWPVIPVLLVGYFNQRLFRYDALAEHASDAELKNIVTANRGALWAIGMILAVLGHIPVVGFFLPVFGGLVFIHYCLARLDASRRATGDPLPAPRTDPVLPPPPAVT